MLETRSVSGYNQTSTTENKAENALLLNAVRSACGFSMMHPTGESVQEPRGGQA